MKLSFEIYSDSIKFNLIINLHTYGYEGNGLRNTRPAAFTRYSVAIPDRAANRTPIAFKLFQHLHFGDRRFPYSFTLATPASGSRRALQL